MFITSLVWIHYDIVPLTGTPFLLTVHVLTIRHILKNPFIFC